MRVRIKWQPYKDDNKPPHGALCRWIILDLLEGLIEIEDVSMSGIPGKEWTSQIIKAWRMIGGAA